MATPNENLAESLKVLNKLQRKNSGVINTHELSRVHRERLLKNGFIREVIMGWYIIVNPAETKGESTIWYSSFWNFCAKYLEERFDNDWCISPEQSLFLHSGNYSIPTQLLVKSPKANNTITRLLYNTSIVNTKSQLPKNAEIVNKNGIRLCSLSSALINCSEKYFEQNSKETRIALAMISDASEILALLLKEGRSVVAGRLIGAFRNIGRDRIANDILKTMKEAGYNIREVDPFNSKLLYDFPKREISPNVIRIKLMWQEMREIVLNHFPKENGIPANVENYLNEVQDAYTTDAYHSLSIEGYKVTAELINRIANETWNPDENEEDKNQKNAMAAKGYWQAFQSVKLSIEKILKRMNAGAVVDEDHGDWYRQLFGPSVTAGILKSSDLAGYRNGSVFILNSLHVPMTAQSVREATPVFFELLKDEKEASVRVVLGHFIFVYIHPYFDGNGRIGRFLMNAMLASGGYPWTVIPVEDRKIYIDTLEKASSENDIVPFTKFLARLVKAGLSGKPIAKKIN